MLNKMVTCCAAIPLAAGLVLAPSIAGAGAPRIVSGLEYTLTDQVIVVGGAGWETVDEPLMRQILGSRYDVPGNRFTNIEWAGYLGTLGNSVNEASDKVYAEIARPENTGEKKIVVGVSASTFVANEVMRRLAADPNPNKPKPEDVSFVIIGDGERGLMPAVAWWTGPELPLVNYSTQKPPVTPYNAIVVKGEYDGLADWPDRPWNLLASLNAVLGSPAVEGFGDIHWDSIWVNLDTIPEKNITVTKNAAGGVTTTYLMPTKELPLLHQLHGQGVPEPVIDALNTVLKPIVDAGYSRNDPQWLKDFLRGRSNGGTKPSPAAVSSAAVNVAASTSAGSPSAARSVAAAAKRAPVASAAKVSPTQARRPAVTRAAATR